MSGHTNNLETRVIRYFSYSAIAIAVISFFVSLPGIFRPTLPLYGKSTSAYFILDLRAEPYIFAIIVGSVIALLFLSLAGLERSFQNRMKSFSKDGKDSFFRLLLVFVFVEIIVSELIEVLNPAIADVFPFDATSPSVVSVAYSSEILIQSFIFQLVPLSISILFLLAIRKRLNRDGLVEGVQSLSDSFIISFIVAVIFAVVSGGPPIEMFSDFLSLFILNVIFLRNGFLRAFLANFTLSMTNVTAAYLAPYPVGTLALTVFLIILGFMGVYVLFGMAVSYSGTVSASRSNDSSGNNRAVGHKPAMELFVRSSCPDCGNTTFHVQPDMALKCTRCGREIPKDATGIPNISVEMASRPHG